MPNIFVTVPSGEEKTIEAPLGYSLMEAIRGAGVDEMLAQCGGCLSCATCHVIVDEEWFPKLGERSEDENDLLEYSVHTQPTSRLSCQIKIVPELEGLRVTVVPEE